MNAPRQSADADTLPGSANLAAGRLRRPLFQKYFAVLFAAVVVPLMIGGASEAWFGYRDNRALLDQRLNVEARAAASRINDFFESIKQQLDWVLRSPWTGDVTQHRLDALRLLHQVPSIVDVALVDGTGIERLKVSRTGLDTIGSNIDRSDDPAVSDARDSRVWYGPVTFNNRSEPFMTIAMSGNRSSVGVVVAEINLKLIWDVIAAIHVGESGDAFAVDRNGRLVAHPDISLVLRGSDVETAARLKALQAAALADRGEAISTKGFAGRTVLVAMAPIAGVDWTVFAEQPYSEALAPIRAALFRTGFLVLMGGIFAVILAIALARRMIGPIHKLEEGASRIGAGQFHDKITIGTGDELERLADRINQMASELALSQERHEKISRLKRFLSPQVAELVEQAGQSDILAGQRADVVVLFCDLRGFTAFSAKAAPEEIMRVLGEYYEALGAVIMRYEATLTHFSGDGIMVLLNAPIPCVDNPACRGVIIAREMQAAVQRLIPGWRIGNHVMGFGIGLAQGVATVGRIGYEGRQDYTAIGNVTNLASRLCSAAGDGEILIDANAAAEISSEIGLSSLGSRRLRGFAEPVAIYKVA